MKPLLATMVMLILPVSALAQPTITRSNWPAIGDLLTVAICSDLPNPGPAGPNQVWDMSGLQEAEEGFFDFVQPTGTAWEAIFPTSNVCTVNWFDAYTYQEVSQDAWHVTGHAADLGAGGEFLEQFDDPEQLAAFPYSFGSTFSDDFSGTSSFGAASFDFAGSVDFEADGYGTLILPTGTYQNVLRYTSHRVEVFNGITEVEDQWTWFSSDYRAVLLNMESITDDFGSEQSVWYNKAPADVTGTADTSWGEIKALYR